MNERYLICTDLDRTLIPNGPQAEPAGARVTSLAGEVHYISPPQSILAANPLIHAQMLAVLKDKG